MLKLFVGIDVAKDASSAQGIDCDGNGRFFLTFTMHSQGFMQLWKIIAEHSKDLTEIIVAVETIVCYHINLYSFLTSKGINTVVVTPLLIANVSKLSLRKTKTDKKDAMTIAQFLLVHRDSITQLSLSQDLQDFRDIARERESVGNMIVAHKVEIKRLLQTTFPELERIGNISTRVMQDFIAAFPSARLVKTASQRPYSRYCREKGWRPD
jgi:transposase